MVREKVAQEFLERVVEYDESHWDLFHELREIAYPIVETLKSFSPLLHGSIARGDISKTSDIDIILPEQVKEFQISVAMDTINYTPLERWLIQATPLSAIKGVLVYTPTISVTFPLIPFYPREYEFYYFGGAVGFDDLLQKKDKRVPGINKQLLFIAPTENGHKEYRVTVDNANIIAKLLNINIDTIFERIRVLERRDSVGRTGVFKKRLLIPSESFGGVLQEIAATDPASRRRIKRKKIS
ncbi:MAG: nucleotidyltransferase domain-containing protein [Candidatus Helarchaeota archaeon]